MQNLRLVIVTVWPVAAGKSTATPLTPLLADQRKWIAEVLK